MGRPTKYTDEIAERICDLIAEGKSLRAAAKEVGIDEKTARNWKRERPEFFPQYAHAEESRADHYVERIIEIVDGITTGEQAQIARVQIDGLKWITSKLAPKKYGDKVDHTLSGPDGGAIPVSLEIDL